MNNPALDVDQFHNQLGMYSERGKGLVKGWLMDGCFKKACHFSFWLALSSNRWSVRPPPILLTHKDKVGQVISNPCQEQASRRRSTGTRVSLLHILHQIWGSIAGADQVWEGQLIDLKFLTTYFGVRWDKPPDQATVNPRREVTKVSKSSVHG